MQRTLSLIFSWCVLAITLIVIAFMLSRAAEGSVGTLTGTAYRMGTNCARLIV
jgi:hypothetical protein